jgi:hypothetical protein
MKREVVILWFSCIFLFCNLPGQDLRNAKFLNSLRRLKQTPSLKEKLEFKLGLVKLALEEREINQAKQMFKSTPEALNELSRKISDSQVARELGLNSEEVTHLQAILRNYDKYSSGEIKRETGFSKSMFPALLYLWMEKGPFYPGKISVFFGSHVSKEDFEALCPTLERIIQEAHDKKVEVIFIVEFGSIGLKSVEEQANLLGVDVVTFLQDKKYRPRLNTLLMNIRKDMEEIYEEAQKGILPPEGELKGMPEFLQEEIKFVAEHRMKTYVEKLSVEALVEGLMGELRFQESLSALSQGNLSEYMEKRWQAVTHIAKNVRLRDKMFQDQIESLAKPNRYVISVRGARHKVEIKGEYGYEVREERISGFLPSPFERLVQMLVEGREISEGQRRDLLMKEIIGDIVLSFLGYKPGLRLDEVYKIAAIISEKWSEKEILQLMNAFSISKQEGYAYFWEWVSRSDLSSELKALFPLP